MDHPRIPEDAFGGRSFTRVDMGGNPEISLILQIGHDAFFSVVLSSFLGSPERAAKVSKWPEKIRDCGLNFVIEC
jgi:hypothetical protein